MIHVSEYFTESEVSHLRVYRLIDRNSNSDVERSKDRASGKKERGENARFSLGPVEL